MTPDGPERALTFDAPCQPGNYALRFVTGAFVLPPDPPRQEADVLITGECISNTVLPSDNEQFEEVRV